MNGVVLGVNSPDRSTDFQMLILPRGIGRNHGTIAPSGGEEPFLILGKLAEAGKRPFRPPPWVCEKQTHRGSLLRNTPVLAQTSSYRVQNLPHHDLSTTLAPAPRSLRAHSAAGGKGRSRNTIRKAMAIFQELVSYFYGELTLCQALG